MLNNNAMVNGNLRTGTSYTEQLCLLYASYEFRFHSGFPSARLPSSMADLIPCYRIVQRAYSVGRIGIAQSFESLKILTHVSKVSLGGETLTLL